MTYVDGFVLPVAKSKIAAYKKMANDAGKIWKKFGALQYFECAGDDLSSKQSTLKFLKMAKAKSNETAVFSFIVFKSKAHRNSVNKKVMDYMKIKYADHMNDPMPFDMKRMAYGGFKTIVKK